MLVLSTSGKIYDVDTTAGRCSCPASRYFPKQRCKHVKALSEHYQRQAKEGSNS